MNFYTLTEALNLQKYFEALRLRLVTVTPSGYAIIYNGQWHRGYYVNLYLDNGKHTTPYEFSDQVL